MGELSNFTVEVDNIDERTWNEYLNCFEDANIYQTVTYGKYHPGGNKLSHLVLKSDNIPVSICQVRILTIPLVSRGIAFVFWGPLWRKNHFEGDRRNILRKALKALCCEYVCKRKLMLRIIPGLMAQSEAKYEELFQKLGLNRNLRYRSEQTILIDLQQTYEQIKAKLSSKWRKNLKTSESNNLEITAGTDDGLFLTFKQLYKELISIKSVPKSKDIDMFMKIQKEIPAAYKMNIFICKSKGEPAAGLVVSNIGNTGTCLLAASNKKGRELNASTLLFWKALVWLKERNFKYYDLGGVNSVDNPGVYQFKSGMGGKEVRFLGEYNACQNEFSRLTVNSGEFLRKIKRQFL